MQRLLAMLGVFCLVFLVGVAFAQATPLPGRDYLVVGQATSEQAPMRACDRRMLAQLSHQATIPAPPQGWSGAPQAVTVFNVLAGEVMVALGGRRICGRMHDARARDTRFRASVGLVAAPQAGSRTPIQVAWSAPLRDNWIPTVRVGSPTQVQQVDTFRLLIRAACLAIALALAFSAMIGFVGTRDPVFLAHVAICVVLLLWQAILSGLSGYPRSWLPMEHREQWWLVAFSTCGCVTLTFSIATQIPAIERCGWVRRAAPWTFAGLMLAALAALILPHPLLRVLAIVADDIFLSACVALMVLAAISLWQRHYQAFSAIAALLPLLTMQCADRVGSQVLIEYRVEVIQLAITWFLIVMAYALTQRYARLRQQRDELRALADTDALTGLPNRRAGLARLNGYLEQARTHQRPLAVGFVDIDLFKQINDRHGHAIGDRVLVAVAKTLTASVRDRADVIRIGGEEFLVLLPGVGAMAARQRLEMIRRRISEIGGHLGAQLGTVGLQVTASIGLATLGVGDTDATELLRRADAAMYDAKRGGRDRVFGVDEAADVVA